MAFWRKQRSGRKIGRWYRPATCIGNEDGNVWLAYGQTVVKCSPAQLRHLTREERISDELIRNTMKEFAEPTRRARTGQKWFVDLTGEEVAPVAPEDVGEMEVVIRAMIHVHPPDGLARAGNHRCQVQRHHDAVPCCSDEVEMCPSEGLSEE